jgi:hypothetical protein
METAIALLEATERRNIAAGREHNSRQRANDNLNGTPGASHTSVRNTLNHPLK